MKRLRFSGYDWVVRDRYGGPGPNNFSQDNAWVDSEGNLHLKVCKVAGIWNCAEVYLESPLGYGEYSFEVKKSRFMDKNITLGLFTYEDDTHEIDIEFGRWSNWFNCNGQFAIQPVKKGNINRFLSLSKDLKASFNWQKDKIEFVSSVCPFNPSWCYKGSNIPVSNKKERVHINLWIYGKNKPKGTDEIVITKFTFKIEKFK